MPCPMWWCSNGACPGTGDPPPPPPPQIKFCLKADLLTWLGVTFLQVFTWLSFPCCQRHSELPCSENLNSISGSAECIFSSMMKIKFHPRLSQRPVNGWVSPSIGGLPDDVSSMLGVGGHGKMAEGWFLEYTSPLAPACFGPLMQLRQRRRPTKISQLIPYCSRTWQNMVAGLFWPSLEGALALKRADPTVYCWPALALMLTVSKRVLSFSLTSTFFYIYFLHNMFRWLASYSRCGFGMIFENDFNAIRHFEFPSIMLVCFHTKTECQGSSFLI